MRVGVAGAPGGWARRSSRPSRRPRSGARGRASSGRPASDAFTIRRLDAFYARPMDVVVDCTVYPDLARRRPRGRGGRRLARHRRDRLDGRRMDRFADDCAEARHRRDARAELLGRGGADDAASPPRPRALCRTLRSSNCIMREARRAERHGAAHRAAHRGGRRHRETSRSTACGLPGLSRIRR